MKYAPKPKLPAIVVVCGWWRSRGRTMQLHQIRYFLLLYEERSFTRAARRCDISQPSLTKAIRALERELGGTLFHRRPAVELSELGRTMLPYLQQIAWAKDMACRSAREFAGRRAAA